MENTFLFIIIGISALSFFFLNSYSERNVYAHSTKGVESKCGQTKFDYQIPTKIMLISICIHLINDKDKNTRDFVDRDPVTRPDLDQIV